MRSSSQARLLTWWSRCASVGEEGAEGSPRLGSPAPRTRRRGQAYQQPQGAKNLTAVRTRPSSRKPERLEGGRWGRRSQAGIPAAPPRHGPVLTTNVPWRHNCSSPKRVQSWFLFMPKATIGDTQEQLPGVSAVINVGWMIINKRQRSLCKRLTGDQNTLRHTGRASWVPLCESCTRGEQVLPLLPLSSRPGGSYYKPHRAGGPGNLFCAAFRRPSHLAAGDTLGQENFTSTLDRHGPSRVHEPRVTTEPLKRAIATCRKNTLG